jgi:DNA-binding response OmpR family regulator
MNDIGKSSVTIPLAPKEQALFEYLTSNAGCPKTISEIFRDVWGIENLAMSSTVNVHISYIRRKLGKGAIVRVKGPGPKSYMIPIKSHE